MTATDIYDFEGNIPDMIAVGFTAAQMNVATVNIPPNFDKPRPRSELMFKAGPASSPPSLSIVTGNKRVISAYTGELEIENITAPDANNKSIHAAYRARVRQIMELDSLRSAVNTTNSPYRIEFIAATGSTQTESTGDGYEVSRLTYHVQFSIKVDAFNQLAAAS